VVGNGSSWGFTRSVKARMAGATELPVTSINAPALVPGVDFSDHLNFWKHGWSAVMITDTAFFRNPNYHLVSDTPDTLDYERMAHVVTGVYAAMTTLSRGATRASERGDHMSEEIATFSECRHEESPFTVCSGRRMCPSKTARMMIVFSRVW